MVDSRDDVMEERGEIGWEWGEEHLRMTPRLLQEPQESILSKPH